MGKSIIRFTETLNVFRLFKDFTTHQTCKFVTLEENIKRYFKTIGFLKR